MRRTWAIISAAVILLFGVAAYAADAQSPHEQKELKEVKVPEAKLDEVIVTTTRTEKSIETAPGSFSVITRENLDSRNVKSLDQSLNLLPGVFNKTGKSFLETTSNISIRGVPDDKRVLFLLDGAPLNDGYTGGVNYSYYSLDDVERIEVVRGPFSSLYGGSAMSGVVQVITRMPEKQEFMFKSGYGSGWVRGTAPDDLRTISLSYGNKFFDKLSVYGSYGYRATNGYPTDLNIQSTAPPSNVIGWTQTTDNQGNARFLIGDKGDNRWWDDHITLKTEYAFTKTTKLSLSFHRGRYEYNYDEPHTYLKNAATGQPVYNYGSVAQGTYLGAMGGSEQNIYSAGLETEIAKVKTKLSLSLNDRVKNWYSTVCRGTTTGCTTAQVATLSGGPGYLSESPMQVFNADLQFAVPLFEKHLLTFGGAYRHGSADITETFLTSYKDEDTKTIEKYKAEGKDHTYSAFAEAEISILNNLTAYIGGRYDLWETFDGYIVDRNPATGLPKAGYPKYYGSRDASSFSPKLSFVYKPFSATTLRTSAGKAFRSPSVYDLYRTWVSSTGTTWAANPNLKPETVKSWDVGIEQGLWQGAKIKAGYFENYMEDLIYRKTVTSTLREFVNAGKAESKGIELEVEQKFGKWLTLFSNYTYTDAKVKENEANPNSVGKRLTQVPQHMFNAGATAVHGPVSGSLTGRYVSKRYANDTNNDTANNVFTSYDPYFVADAKVSYQVTRHSALSLSVDNILDKQYFGYYPAPGRTWFAELKIKL